MSSLPAERNQYLLEKFAKGLTLGSKLYGTGGGEALRAVGQVIPGVGPLASIVSMARHAPRRKALTAVVEKVMRARKQGLDPLANLDKSERLLVQQIKKPTGGATNPLSRFASHGAGQFLAPTYGIAQLLGSPFKMKQKIMMRGMRGRISKAMNEGLAPTTYLSKDQKSVYFALKNPGMTKAKEALKKVTR